jgi:hypothetical protein
MIWVLMNSLCLLVLVLLAELQLLLLLKRAALLDLLR